MHVQDAPTSGLKPAWLERVVRSARTFDPSLDELVARSLAESEFAEAGRLDPEEAAEAYATSEFQARTPAPGTSAANSSPLVAVSKAS